MLYIIVILVAMALIAVANIVFNTFDLSVWYIVIAVIVNTIAVIAVAGLFAYIIRHLLPRKWFEHGKKCYEVSKKETRFYEKLGIKKWKELIPELGGFSGFHKNMQSGNVDSVYLERFLYEVNCGYVIHVVDMIVGFLIILMYPLQYWYMFGLPVALVSFVLHYLPVCVLRYNSPRLAVMYKAMLRKEARSAVKE